MTAPALPPIEALIDIRAELLAEHGGAPGMRDRAALEASLARPLQIIADTTDEPPLAALAAALCVSICRNPPFVDGNKRTAFAALGMTLGLNEFFLDATEREAADAILAVAAGRMTEEDFRDWVLSRTFRA